MPNSNLPVPLTRFIGREKEIAEVMRLSTQTRLLTLTGSGGCGKTRLALEVAARLADSFEHNVAWVELAPLNDAALVPQAVAQVLDVQESTNQPLTQSLANYLRPQRLLLILDNCEHLITACAHLANEILQACPHLFILATSREALNIAGETAWRVPPLEIPNPKTTTTPEALLVAESARLFVDRAVSTESTFAVNRQNTNAIAQICYRLDGMPLAIELAAARIKSLPVEQIAARLDDRFRLLNLGSRTAPPRQQTMRAVIDWSYGLLSPTEKILFRRLAVFAGGWTLDAAEAICSGDGLTSSEILDSLARLVDKSLVIAQNNVARYQMLETIRQYAREKLIEANELPLLQARHCDFFVQLGEEAEPKLKGPEAKEWMDRLETEYDNIRAVFEFAMTNEVASAVRLAWSLLMLWVRRSYLIEGRSVVLQMLARPELQGANRLRLQALKTIGYLQTYLLDSVAIRAYFEEGLTIAKMLKDENDLAFTLHGMGEAFFFLGDLPGARPWFEESLMLYRKTGNRWGEAQSLFSLGNVMWELGDIQQGWVLLEESLQAFHITGDLLGTVWPLANLGALVRNQSDYTRAVLYYTQCIEILKRFNDRIRLAYALYGQAMSILGQGDYRRAGELFAEGLELIKRRASPILLLEWLLGTAGVIRGLDKPKPAAQLIGAADGLFESFRTQGIHSHSYYKLYNLISSEVRAELSAETFTHLWQEGHALDLDQAIEFALAEMKSADVPDTQTTSLSPRQAAKEKFDGLTAREREVAALITQGKSNREIAEIFVLSERTIEGHVGNILNKLGFNARTQIATWATQKGLVQDDAKA